MRPNSSLEISTHNIPSHLRAKYWVSHVNRHIITLDCPDELDTGIEASLVQYDLGDIRFNHIKADAHGVQRSSANISSDGRGYAMMSLMLNGEGFACQGVQGTQHMTGDIVIYNTLRPYTLAFPDDVEMMVINLPLDLLKHVFGGWDQKDLIKLDRQIDNGGYSTSSVFQIVQSYCQGHCSGEVTQERLLEQLHGIINQRSLSNSNRNLHKLLLRSKSWINQHLQLESINAEVISHAMHTSTRQLARAFSLEGSTVGRYIWNQRLEHCREDILNIHHPNDNISDIAFRWGFNHSAHFSRSYKTRFGEPPSETRRKVLR